MVIPFPVCFLFAFGWGFCFVSLFYLGSHCSRCQFPTSLDMTATVSEQSGIGGKKKHICGLYRATPPGVASSFASVGKCGGTFF